MNDKPNTEEQLSLSLFLSPLTAPCDIDSMCIMAVAVEV